MTHIDPVEDKPTDPLSFLDAIANEQAALLSEAQKEHLFLAFAFYRRNLPYCPATVESHDSSGDDYVKE